MKSADLQDLWDAGMEETIPAGNGTAMAQEQQTGAEAGELSDISTQFSIRVADGNKVAWIDDDVLAQKPDGQKVLDYIRTYLAYHMDDVYTILEDGSKVYPDAGFPGEYTHSEYTKQISKSRKLFGAKMRMVPGIGEMVEIATWKKWEPAKHTHNKDAKYGVDKYTTRVAFDRGRGIEAYKATIVILNSSNGRKYIYDIDGIKKDNVTANSLMQAGMNGKADQQQTNVVKSSVAQFAEDVNRENQEQFSTRDQTDTVSVREYLAGMTPKSYMNDTEVELLKRYQTKLKALQEKQRAGLMRLFRHFVHASPAVLPHAPPPHWLIGFIHYTIVQGK